MSTKLKDIVEEIRDLVSDAEDSASEAEYGLHRARVLLDAMQDSISYPVSPILKEAASAGLAHMVAKYGHSSVEVKEVEDYIARKK